jgi:isoquinoline 1-oxidoreductase subunit alpha
MPTQRFKVNGERVEVDIEDDVRVLWVLRDVLGITGPKYGCAGGICRACTCLVNGEARTVCTIEVGDLKPGDEITTIEGLAPSETQLHPMQEAWIEEDVAQCGYCQPGQILSAVALVEGLRREGRSEVTDADLDRLRNVCRCGTYPRIRAAIRRGAEKM